MANWKFILASSAALTPVSELSQARERTLDVGLNMPGSASCWLPLDHESSSDVQPYTTCIMAYRDSTCAWSGPVWTLEEDAIGNKLNVTALGWFELLNHRFVRGSASPYNIEKRVFTATDAGTIAREIVRDVDNAVDVLIDYNGTYQTTQNRTITYEQYTVAGQAISDLSALEAGFDWDIDPVTRKFNVYSTRMTDRPEVQFGYRAAVNNVSALTRRVDCSELATYVVVQGKGASASAGGTHGTYGRFEETVSLADVADAGVLAAYAGVEVTLRETPRVTFDFVPRPAGSPGAMSPFQDYFVGDKVYLSAKQGRLDVSKQAQRVFGITLSIDENGGERVTGLRTSPA